MTMIARRFVGLFAMGIIAAILHPEPKWESVVLTLCLATLWLILMDAIEERK